MICQAIALLVLFGFPTYSKKINQHKQGVNLPTLRSIQVLSDIELEKEEQLFLSFLKEKELTLHEKLNLISPGH